MDKVSISFSRYQTKHVIKFLFRQMMTPWTFKIFLEWTPKAMADRETKRGRWKYKNVDNEKSFLDEIKKHFL